MIASRPGAGWAGQQGVWIVRFRLGAELAGG